MQAIDVIIKKRDGNELSRQEIDYFIRGITSGDIPDYQASAWAMAVLLKGMTPRETTDLTLAMAHSGEILDLSGIVGISVDKHSTGGVGDKTTLVVLPIVAACGLPCGKMSGRGLGFSGGTLDKLESIPGYRCDLSTEEFIRQLKGTGIVLSGQSMDLAPADGKLYALRDVTGTVQSIPLIASSIMSKKIAAGAQAIVLDVKVGLGAFMQTLDDARELAKQMIAIGEMVGRKVVALLSDMNQPLGNAVGNALEVREAINTLRGTGPTDFLEHCLHVSAQMLLLGRRAESFTSARKLAVDALNSGSAFEKFCILVESQNGDISYIMNPEKLPQAKFVTEGVSGQSGWISQISARKIGEAAMTLGAGRIKKGDPIDHSVGIVIHHKVGDRAERGERIFTVYANNEDKKDVVRKDVLSAFKWKETPVTPLPLFYE